MTRRTFFSFHYKPDVSRAWTVRNSWVTKVAQGLREGAGFFDGSVFEAKLNENEESLKRFLREGLTNTSVTCVLVGEHTCWRRWVRYEILRSFMRGNGLLAIRIDSIGSIHSPAALRGEDPFDKLAFTVAGERLRFQELWATGWEAAADVPTMPLNEVAYDLKGCRNHTFSTLFPIYDWQSDGGFENVSTWIETAAAHAGRR